VLGIPVIYPRYEPPPGWELREEPTYRLYLPPGVPATAMQVSPLAGRQNGSPAPGEWLDRLLAAEGQRRFVPVEQGARAPIAAPSGLRGLAVEIVGGYDDPQALVEKRTYVALADDLAIYPFALLAGVNTHAAHAPQFWQSVMSVRRFAP
jgi:hypothetical protein